MPPNTKKCCGDCGFAQLPPKTGIDCVQPKCPCHTPNTKKCRLCTHEDDLIGCEHDCHTPSLDKSEHDGTCRTPECYEKRPTPAVEDWEEKLKVMILSRGMGVSLNDCVNYVRSLLKSDRKRIVEEIDNLEIAEPMGEERAGGFNQALKKVKDFITNLK